MGDRDANTHRKVVEKVVEWIWLSAERFLGMLAPLAIVSLILVLCARSVHSLLFEFGIRTTGPETNGAEDAVLLLAVIVVPLLLHIARVLEEIARRMK